MKWTALITAALTFATIQLSLAEELLKNGDFQKGSSGWKGKENIEYDSQSADNKICVIEVDDDDDISFFQPIKCKDFKDLEMTFKIKKSSDYEGRGYQIRFERQDGSYTYSNREVPANTEWNEVQFKFSDIRDSDRINVMIIVRSGDSGSLAFDDFSVEGS